MADQAKIPDVPEAAAPAPVAPAVTAAVSAVSEKAQETIAKTTEQVKEMTAKYGLLVLVGIVVAVILFFLAYWLYLYLSTRLTNKLTVTVAETKVPRKGTEVSKIKGGEFPPMSNGNRVTYSFWIYIHDINKFAGTEMRHVLHFGDQAMLGASPAVFLDGKLNKMYIRFDKSTGAATNFETRLTEIRSTTSTDPAVQEEKQAAGYYTTSGANTTYTDLNTNEDKKYDALLIDMSKRGIIIDYIPLQRWVHVAVVVNETVNEGYMAAYLDGELVKSISSVDKIKLSNGTNIAVSFQNLNLIKAGDLYLGGDIYNTDINKGFSGMVSKVTISNFDLNGEEIKRLYVQGPMDNLSSKLGLPAYGLRSPVYRVG
jgi:hypothetical protein